MLIIDWVTEEQRSEISQQRSEISQHTDGNISGSKQKDTALWWQNMFIIKSIRFNLSF